MGILNIGVTGLNAAQAGLLTTSHNIANASTPGYSRQEIVQTTNVSRFVGGSYIGSGAHVVSVRRSYDDFLGRQAMSAEANASEMESFRLQVSQIDSMFANSDGGLSPAFNDFFKGVQDVAANPQSIAARQSMLSAGQSLVSRFQSLDQRLSDLRQGVNDQIGDQVRQINALSTQVAEINKRIAVAKAANANQAPNDLLDQRNQMLKDLNKLIRVNTVEQSDGSYNVFIGSGQPLVVGEDSFQLAATRSNEDNERMTVGIQNAAGATQQLAESQVTGGSLGGLLRFREQSLDGAQNALGRIALTFAGNFNDQHRLGQDLTGAIGTDVFSVASPQVVANAKNTGSGSPAVSIDTATTDQLTTSDYRLSFTAGNYRLTRLADNQVQTFASLPQTVDGMTIAAGSWAPAANDSVIIRPTRGAARGVSLLISDARQIAAAAPIKTSASLANTGTGAISAGTVDAPSPVDPNLKHKVTISFTSATTFDVFDNTAGASLATGVAYVSGQSISYNGWTASVSGKPAKGDSFVVDTNSNGVGDNRNAVLLGALQNKNTMGASATAGATMSYQSAYSQMVSAVGAKTNEVTAIGAAQQSLADQSNQALQSVAGVNLDEEAANLVRYQQAYQAAAKVLDIGTKIFDEILALGR